MFNASSPSRTLNISLIVGGVLGLLASFMLTVSKIASLEDAGTSLMCDISGNIQCSANLSSWQGAIFFGISNSIIGLMVFPIPIVLGVLGLLNINWFGKVESAFHSPTFTGWLVGISLGFVWVCWFMYQSFFVIGTLCLWCVIMWLGVILSLVSTVGYALRLKATAIMGITLGLYAFFLLLGQFEINWIGV